MIEELGIGDLEPARQVSLLSHVLGNAAKFVKKQLGMVQYPTSNITQAVGERFGIAEAHEASDLYKVAERASQRFTASERTRQLPNAEFFSFWKPRYTYAQSMLTCAIPQEHLSQVPPQHLPGGGQDAQEVVRWALEANLPLFAQIEVRSLEENIGRLMNYGAGAAPIQGEQYEARNFREWVALPELMVLVQSGDIGIRRVLVASGWHEHGLRTVDMPSAQVSYAYGLVAENIWCGLMRQPSRYGRISKTLATAWLQAYDRMQMLAVAEKLSQIGFEIRHFGNGRVAVTCPPFIRAHIPGAAQELGLMYPASLDGLEMYPVTGSNPMHLQQKLLASKDFGSLLTVDNHLLREF